MVPSYRAPRMIWNLSGGVARKDKPTAYLIGETVLVRLFDQPGEGWKNVRARIMLENTSGSQDLSGTDALETAQRIGGFRVTAGLARLVLRGEATDAKGKIWPIAVRGPIVEGLDENAWRELGAHEGPPRFAKGKRRVAIYADGQAARGLIKALQDAPGVDAQLFYYFPADNLNNWGSADVVILPQLNDVADLSFRDVTLLRRYVERGGRLILTHDAVGYRWHPRLFPEIGVGIELSKGQDLVVGANEFGIAPGALKQGYSDHVVIAPAPNSTVLAREKDGGKAVVVSGKVWTWHRIHGRRAVGLCARWRDARRGKTIVVGVGGLTRLNLHAETRRRRENHKPNFPNVFPSLRLRVSACKFSLCFRTLYQQR